MIFWNKQLPGHLYCRSRLQQIPHLAVGSDAYDILESPVIFRRRLLELIAAARVRIMMTVLYVQDDPAGREILDALYRAKAAHPNLYVRIYLDFHRAQRGLIGKAESPGNSALYYRLADGCDSPPAIYGVPVKRREIFGVMHLKGCVCDDTVLYSGASVNDVYLARAGAYRLDRYHEIRSRELADALCGFVTTAFHPNFAVQDFSQGHVRPAREIREEIRQLTRHLTQMQYNFKNARLTPGTVGITPLSGLGRKRNQLNRTILLLLGAARQQITVCTPYFNLPKPVHQALEAALRRGVKILLIVGDKTANDFFLRPDEPFSPVGAIPYIYEQNLREFMTRHEADLRRGALEIRLWRDGDNSFHVKGIFVDHDHLLVTGNNLNPRAWALDLENGLLVSDPEHLLQEKGMHEQQYLLRHARRLDAAADLEELSDYPEEVRKILLRVRRFKATFIIRQLL